ncbi:MAG: hypothetical protein CMK83_05290 [Pseudomonadales bacterium]|nr:hypothetical protein [Pseudomonadales bacterium]MEC8812848.1 hypothetical protein [Pseudomonadota bacterium]TNC90812.1 MAG: hypothetical protein CSH49_01365 [Alcanivorax sp.]HAG96615.1 hypothetical protein [Gammaproteobacteria bacterium]MAQ23613.1 hypothetical protein [Pseudomonadales bacterium]
MNSRTIHRVGTLLLMLFTIVAANYARAQQTTEIYETYLPANKLVPILEPLLGPDDKVTAYHNKLFVKASPAVQDELLAVLQEIDRPLKNIQVSLRYADNSQLEAQNQSAQGQIVVYKGSSRESGVDVQVVNKNRFSTHVDSADHQIRVLEGEQGVLEVGKDVPVDQFVFLGPLQTGTVKEYRSVSNQLYVVPKLVKDRVRIEVYTSNQRMKRNSDNQIQKMDAQTIVVVEPGIWTPLAGTTRSTQDASNAVSYSTRRTGSGEKSLQIRADIVD